MIRYLLLAMLIVITGPSRAALEITISGGEIEPVPVAVVPFEHSALGELDADIAAVVQADLVSSGLFTALPRTDMLEQPSEPGAVNYGNWRALHVDHLVIGRIRAQDSGSWAVEFRLLDVFRGTETLAFEIPVSRSGLRYAAHKVADLIYQQLTGHRGVFNTQIAYITAEGPIKQRRTRLLIADADGYNARELVSSSEPIMSPTWSPDRRQMAFVAFNDGRSAVYLQTVATGRVRKITERPGINGAPAWSPDGRRLAVTLSYEGNPEIYIVDVATGATTRLTHSSGIDTEAAWSPDGREILFTSDRGGRAQLYRMPVEGGVAERLTFEGRSNARGSYSPDGKRIALIHQDDSGYRVAVMERDTGRLTVLGEGPLDESPSFAPNGIVIIYAHQGRGGTELATVAVDTKIRRSLRQSGDVREPSWSPYAD